MALDFAKLKERLEQAQGKGKKRDEIWWKPSEGEQTIRIVPTKDEDPFKDYHFHYNMGKHSGFLCPKKNFGEECSVCDFASQLWREGSTEEKELAKKLFARQRFFSAVVEREEGSADLKFMKPKIWGYSKTVYESLIKYCLNEDFGDITAIKDGNDLKLTYGKTPGALFPSTEIQPRVKKTSLCADMSKKECEQVLEDVPNFLDHMTRKSSAEVQQMLNEWAHEGASASEDSSDGKEGLDLKEEKKKKASSTSENPVDQAFDELLSD